MTLGELKKKIDTMLAGGWEEDDYVEVLVEGSPQHDREGVELHEEEFGLLLIPDGVNQARVRGSDYGRGG